MKRIVTVFLVAFFAFAVGANAQTSQTLHHSTIKLSAASSATASGSNASAPNVVTLPPSEDQTLATQTDTISYLQDTSNGMVTAIDPLNQLPYSPNASDGDSLVIGKSVDQFGSITINGSSVDDTLYKRVMALRVNTPTDITSPKLVSVNLSFFPIALDPNDVIQVWAVPIVDEQTQDGSIYPFIDLFSQTRTASPGSPYATGTIAASAVTLGQVNTINVKLGSKPMYVGKVSISQFAICVFINGPGYFNDSVSFLMDYSQEQDQVDTDGSANGTAPMRTYYAVLDGGMDFVDPNTGGTDFITNGVSGFLTGIYTVPGDANGNFLGNMIATTIMSGTALSSVSSDNTNANSLDGNYPNPVSAATDISYNLAASGPVTLNVFNQLGQNVGTVVNAIQGAGAHTATFNIGTLPDGVYYYKLQSGEFTATNTMVVAR